MNETALWDEYQAAVEAYWKAVDAIPVEDLESWAAIPFPQRPEPRQAQPRKRKKKSDDEPIGTHCPDCGMKWFRCVCPDKPDTRGADLVGQRKSYKPTREKESKQ
jgi:hypothetical protein